MTKTVTKFCMKGTMDMSEITDGFDTAFAEIGFDYNTMSNLNEIADVVSNALYELHDIMTENNLYEKYPMKNKVDKECSVFDAYDKKLSRNMEEASTERTPSGHEYVSVIRMEENLVESSLKSITELIQETLGKEYGIECSYTDAYHDSKLMIGKYEYSEGSLTDKVNDILEQQLEHE